ncbi:MAG: hypothetical protein U9Q85_00655 [Patescibacteria group bacterium]|nr:hypothetical protein [Patescibacteria group bacterium]
MTKTEDSYVEGMEDNDNNVGIDDLEIDSDGQEQDQAKQLVLDSSKAAILTSLIDLAEDSIGKIKALLGQEYESSGIARIGVSQAGGLMQPGVASEGGHIIEGVFDGENMIGPDGKQYSVPANYASKSKLVEGDVLKLTITSTGTFIYKQIGPIDRKRVVGVLEQTPSGNFHVVADNKKWRVLTASVTYFKGQDSDEVVILVPKVGESNWAVVENVVRQPKA